MSDAAAILARAVRRVPLHVEPRVEHTCRGGTHSHLSDERVVCWTPSGVGRFAVDAELADQAVPSHLGQRWGERDPQRFLKRWCATEIVAKLADEPVVILAGQEAVVSSPVTRGGVTVHWIIRRVNGLVVAQGLTLDELTCRPTG